MGLLHFVDLPMDPSILTGSPEDAELSSGRPARKEPSAGSRAETGKDGKPVSIPDALILCIRDTARVDIKRIASAAGVSSAEVIEALRGAIYLDPDKWDGVSDKGWETAEEYLSGNLRYKLIKARVAYKTYGGTFGDNVRALEAILPPGMKTEDIYAAPGSPWIPADVIDEFVNHLVQPLFYDRCTGTIHDEETGSWEIPEKGRYSTYVRNTTTFGTPRISAVQILERTLNMKTIRVTDEVRSETTKSGTARVVNREDTAAAQAKQQLIIDEFRRWVWQDKERSQRLKRIFENRYACKVARRFDGRFLEFPGMADGEELFPYQKDAVARILFTPNTLLAHDVGAGKTYIMTAAAMELKRLGMARKPMFVVPNNLVEQWRSIFMTLYPSARLLIVDPRSFTTKRKTATLREIRDGDWDGIIIAYSCFDRIPLSRSHYIESLRAERKALENAKEKKKKNVTGRFSRKLEKIDTELAKLAIPDSSGDPGDIFFDELGIDRLFVDEAHNYKNISIDTRISGVYGISRKGSVKCDALMEKVHHVQRANNGGGVVMATGTPITNSVSDIYVFQKYLQSGELELLGLQTFDSWVGMFAEKTTEFEIAVDTNSYRLATRFSTFHNIPELTAILASVSDFHGMDSGSGIPETDGRIDVLIPKSAVLSDYLEEISVRADRVHERKVKREEDNMLRITGDGRRAALDIRLVKPELIPFGDSYEGVTDMCKVSKCAEKAAVIWHRTKEDRLTQLVFCDTSTPKAGFNIYDDLRDRLIALGVSAGEIAFIHDADTETKREKLFSKVRKGGVRILIGSTFKLGLGVNVQDRLFAVHHLDLPWRPADMVQREGRILRTGNMNPRVEIYRYITEGSFDAYSWQLLETKQRFISDLLSGTAEGRSGGEVDDAVLDYAEVKALALGNPLLKSRVETRNEITRLSVLRRKSIENRLLLEQRYRAIPDELAAKEFELETCKADISFMQGEGRDLYEGRSTFEKSQIAVYRKHVRTQLARGLAANVMYDRDRSFIEYRGFTVVLPANMDAEHPFIRLVREGIYRVDMGGSEKGALVRIDNFIENKLDARAEAIRRDIDRLLQEQTEIEEILSAEEEYADRIDEFTRRLGEIDRELGVGGQESA